MTSLISIYIQKHTDDSTSGTYKERLESDRTYNKRMLRYHCTTVFLLARNMLMRKTKLHVWMEFQ